MVGSLLMTQLSKPSTLKWKAGSVVWASSSHSACSVVRSWFLFSAHHSPARLYWDFTCVRYNQHSQVPLYLLSFRNVRFLVFDHSACWGHGHKATQSPLEVLVSHLAFLSVSYFSVPLILSSASTVCCLSDFHLAKIIVILLVCTYQYDYFILSGDLS